MGFITNQKTIFKIQKYIPVGYVVVDVQRLHEEKNSSDEKKINFAVFYGYPFLPSPVPALGLRITRETHDIVERIAIACRQSR